MKYQVIYLDIDETLVDAHRQIPPSTLDALRTAQARGIRVGLATGRMYSSARTFAEAVHADAPLILYNGARVETPGDRRILFQRNLPLACARRAFRILSGFDIHCNLYVGDRLFVERWNPRAWESMVKDTVYAQPVGALMEFLREDPVKLLLIGNGTVLEAFRDAYLVGLDDPPHVVRSEETYLEILARGVSKGEALTAVCQSMGIPLSAVVAFGDSYNDMEMLERAGLGVAMGTSPPAVKARAGHVTAGTREDGVASALWRFVL